MRRRIPLLATTSMLLILFLWSSKSRLKEGFENGVKPGATSTKEVSATNKIPTHVVSTANGLPTAEAKSERLPTSKSKLERLPTSKPKLANSGCISRKLGNYKPVDPGLEYEHPQIVHYTKLSLSSSVSLTFMDYMAVMSAYNMLQPERILIHTYTDIHGKYWDLTQKWENTSVLVNKVKRTKDIHFGPIQHQADYVKLRGLLEYGGVISDFDVIIVNGTKLKRMQRLSECVLSKEGDYINAGFLSCIRNSSYIRKWLDSYYKDYRPRLWLHNASFIPKYILEEKSGVCYNMYVVNGIATDPAYAKADKKWLAKNGVNWEAKVAAHYFSKRMKQSDESVLQQEHSFGKMLQYVAHSH